MSGKADRIPRKQSHSTVPEGNVTAVSVSIRSIASNELTREIIPFGQELVLPRGASSIVIRPVVEVEL